MDLSVLNSVDINSIVHSEYCIVNSVTAQSISIPPLGIVSIADPSLSVSWNAYVRCLISDKLPSDSIILPPWITLQSSGNISKVHIQCIDQSEPLGIIKKLTVIPLNSSSSTNCQISTWINKTNISNAHHHVQSGSKRSWIEQSIRRKIEGQVAAIGSLIYANVKAQAHVFKILAIEYDRDGNFNIGVIDENTALNIENTSITEKNSNVKYGGIDSIVQDISKIVVDSFSKSGAYTQLGIPNEKSIIITGVAGSGKKTIVRRCCEITRLRLFPLSLAQSLADRELIESDQAGYLSNIRTVFDLALQAAPCAIIIQDLDLIAKDRGIDSTLLSSTLSIISREMARAHDAGNVFIFGISNNRAKLPDMFSKKNIFSHEYQISMPLKTQRHEILKALSTNLENPVAGDDPEIGKAILQVSQMTSGFVVKDLLRLCRSSLLHKLRNDKTETKGDSAQKIHSNLGFPSWSNFSHVIPSYKPSQQIEFESITRSSSLEKYGGYAKLKKQVYQTIHWPLTNPETFKRMGVKPPMGLLLYGPSGCGKTLLIHSLASELSMNFIPIKGPEIFSKYLGETEATLRRLFAMARQIAPCILFFDEMDSIGAKRGWGGNSQDSNGVNERVLSTLLNEMDGVEERTNVFVVGCTNQPQAIDDALLRPGRLDQLIYVGYPGFQDRKDIIRAIGQRIPLPSDDESIDQLAHSTVGFSPADLSGLFREAAISSLRSNINSSVVNLEEIQQVVKRQAPSMKTRIDFSNMNDPDCSDVLIPEQYRQFQQDR